LHQVVLGSEGRGSVAGKWRRAGGGADGTSCVVLEAWMDRDLIPANFVNYMSVLLLIHNFAIKTLGIMLNVRPFWNFLLRGYSSSSIYLCFSYTTVSTNQSEGLT